VKKGYVIFSGCCKLGPVPSIVILSDFFEAELWQNLIKFKSSSLNNETKGADFLEYCYKNSVSLLCCVPDTVGPRESE
jgi:hypothetical protein